MDTVYVHLDSIATAVRDKCCDGLCHCHIDLNVVLMVLISAIAACVITFLICKCIMYKKELDYLEQRNLKERK